MAKTGSSNMDVKKANRNRIFRLIHRCSGISKPEIAHSLQISLPTVLQNVKSLLEAGLVMEDGNLKSTGGRKAIALTSVKNARTAIGVDITRNHVDAVLIAMDGAILANHRARAAFSTSAAYVDRLGKIVETMLESASADTSRVVGAGVSVPGIHAERGDVLSRSHVLDTANYRFEPITRRLGLPCVYLNDANAAGIAEMWTSVQARNFVYLSLSDSVGGALIWDGQPRLGDNQRSGEFGHMTVERGGSPCYCGKKGCLDCYCAATILSTHTNNDLAAFFKKLEAGDAKLRSIWNRYLDYLATAVHTLRMIFDYNIVLGGYVGAHLDPYIADLRRRAAALNPFEETADYLEVCRHKKRASAVGAALVQIEKFIEGICGMRLF
ncbi:MAG: ROK family transcriptional regulator [Planctomycetes bacterium]|nr:ROK family transcriptional regulator [Planctomycetota bacterium]